ncbi:MAG: porin family protein [Bacteroidota bacterium]
MFNKVLIHILLITLPIPSLAQVSWGAKGGASVTTLGTSNIYQPRLAYHAGLYYAQHLEDQYGMQFELIYSLQGARVNNGANGRLNYHYITVPAVLKLYFKETIYAEVGPQIAYLLKATYKETGFEEDRTSSVKKFDFLGLIGFGKDTDMGGSMGIRLGVGATNPAGASVGNTFVPRNLFMQFYVALPINEFE